MTMDTLWSAPIGPRPAVANRGASYLAASRQVAARTIKKFVRTPALIVAGTAPGRPVPADLPLRLWWRRGAYRQPVLCRLPGPWLRRHRRPVSGDGRRSGSPKICRAGSFDRLRSLPIRLMSIVTGRVGADSALVAWGVLVMTAAGFAVGFRIDGSIVRGVAAFGLTVLYGFAFVWLFIAHGALCGKPAGGPGAVVPGLSFELRVVGLRARLHHAGMDAGFRQQPADDPHVQHGQVADGWNGRSSSCSDTPPPTTCGRPWPGPPGSSWSSPRWPRGN